MVMIMVVKLFFGKKNNNRISMNQFSVIDFLYLLYILQTITLYIYLQLFNFIYHSLIINNLNKTVGCAHLQ